MHARNNFLGNPYTHTFRLEIFPLVVGDVYEISFYVFYLCDGPQSDCQLVNESITVRIDNWDTTYAYDQLINNPTWVKKTILYWPNDDKTQVCSNKSVLLLLKIVSV